MIKANLISITAFLVYDFFHMQFPSTIYFIEIISGSGIIYGLIWDHLRSFFASVRFLN